MSLTRYEPWRLLDELNKAFYPNRPARFSDDTSAVATANWIPSVDVHEEENRFVISADLPGIAKEDIKIAMHDHVLSIGGERKSESEEKTKKFTRAEKVYGKFESQFTLPDTADIEGISAKHLNGVLEIVIPKVNPARGKQIDIRVE